MIYTNSTTKSILFTKDNVNLQLIYFKFFKTPEEIFNTFDFTVNMAVYDCAEEKFVLHDSFLKDVAQRRLSINPNTSFPIISLLRVDKYKQKGYSISRKDFVNLCLSVNKLSIDSWEELANAIGGMYGYTYTDLFDTKKDFSIDEAINQLLLVESNMNFNPEKTSTGSDYHSLSESIRVNLKIIPKEESNVFYKKVSKTDDSNIFSSIYQPSFKYKIGENVNGGDCGIWAYKSIRAAMNHSGGYNPTEIIILKLTDTARSERDSGKTFKIYGDVNVVGIHETEKESLEELFEKRVVGV